MMKKLFRSPVATGLLFVLSVILLFAGGIGGAQAALQYESGEYTTELKLRNIGVVLRESTKPDGSGAERISWRFYGRESANGVWSEQTGNLIKNMVKDAGDKVLKIGKEYPFYLSVENPVDGYTPNAPDAREPVSTYVRVTLYKYWVDSAEQVDGYGWYNGSGDKRVQYDPTLIEIIPADGSEWRVEDTTDERMVFYRDAVLNPGETTGPLTKGLVITSGIADLVSKEETTSTIGNTTRTVTTYKYVYDGVRFAVEAQVDAVQAKHSENSVPSAWGVDYVG